MNEVVKFAVNQDSALGTASTKDTGTAAGDVPLNSSLVPKSGGTFTGDITAPKITASTGILFGTDTAAANTLDDYEEGTWTPTGGNNENISGVTFSDAAYTKIGSLVTITGIIAGTISATNNETRIEMTLPFVNRNNDWHEVGIVASVDGASTSRIMTGVFLNGQVQNTHGFFYFSDPQITSAGSSDFEYSFTYRAS
jgi:hypothetical protein